MLIDDRTVSQAELPAYGTRNGVLCELREPLAGTVS